MLEPDIESKAEEFGSRRIDMKHATSQIKKGLLLAIGTLGLAFAVNTRAQVQTTTKTTPGESTQTVKVERGEVVAVEGNELIVKMNDGSIRHFPDVPETARVTVDGKRLGIHDLQPGMKLQRTITTTTTPLTVTTIQTVKGKIWHVTPPSSVILTLENGTNQEFKIPRDQKFEVNGQMLDAFALKKGMLVTATKIVEAPGVITAQQKKVTGTAPKPPEAPTAAATPQASEVASANGQVAPGTIESGSLPKAPLLIATGEPTPVPEAGTPAGTGATPAEPTPESPSYLSWIKWVVILLIAWLVVRFIRAKSRK
jgi:hypothetical protein